jgi:hypothetical protein
MSRELNYYQDRYRGDYLGGIKTETRRNERVSLLDLLPVSADDATAQNVRHSGRVIEMSRELIALLRAGSIQLLCNDTENGIRLGWYPGPGNKAMGFTAVFSARPTEQRCISELYRKWNQQLPRVVGRPVPRADPWNEERCDAPDACEC